MMHAALDASPRPTSTPTDAPPLLYRHSKRDDWGLAVVVWEREGKRGYRFEGGGERTFKEGYYHLFTPTAAVGEVAESLLASLVIEPAKDPSAARRAKRAAMPTLPELVAVFHEEYPGGFGDARWVSRIRGEGVSRRAKRHREAAIADAQAQLGKDALDGLLAEGKATEIVQRTIAVLAATDLVTKAQLAPLRSMMPTPALAKALRDLMHEPDVDGAHFDRLVRMLRRARQGKPSWPLLTALRALVDPKGDVYVRPSVFRTMAEIITPSLARAVRPHGGYYNRCVAMFRELRQELGAMGEPARDLLDVHDFIWTVCRPAAAKVLARVRQRAAMASVEPATEPTAETPEATMAATATPITEPAAPIAMTTAVTAPVTESTTHEVTVVVPDEAAGNDGTPASDVEAA